MYLYVHPYGTYYIPSIISAAEVDYRNSVRLIWEQHIAWTRSTVMSLIFNLPDIDFVVARLLRNAKDNGDSLKPFYGNEVGEEYSRLIHEHLTIAADLVKAAIAGDSAKFESLDKKWHGNADEIAILLSTINPYLNRQAVQQMMYHHLKLLKEETVAILQGDYKLGIEKYDETEIQILTMADAISKAIIRQFPDIFR